MSQQTRCALPASHTGITQQVLANDDQNHRDKNLYQTLEAIRDLRRQSPGDDLINPSVTQTKLEEMRKKEGRPNYNHCRCDLSGHLTNLPGTWVVPANQGNKLTRVDKHDVIEEFQLVAGLGYLEYVMMNQMNHQRKEMTSDLCDPENRSQARIVDRTTSIKRTIRN